MRSTVDTPDGKSGYGKWVRRAKASQGDRGLEHAIGGEFEAFGNIEREMLAYLGLAPEGYLIDVGCGSGRLAIPLSRTHSGRYLGTDIVDDLLDYARRRVSRRDWRFALVEKLEIPETDDQADMVCMFSVLTHLRHEQSFLYLREAKRVLKPRGKIVFSFLEFAMNFHWDVFQQTIADEETLGTHPLNTFIERNAISAWAEKLDLQVLLFKDGDDPFVPLPERVLLDNGNTMENWGNLGQSICVLQNNG